MGYIHADVAVFLFLSIGAIAVFSFVSVVVWSDNRRKERVAYYRSETLKKIAETQGPGGTAALDYLREQEQRNARRQREGMRLGGLITAAVGIGVMALLRGLAHDEPVYLSGLIPLLIGIVMFVYVQFMAPKV
jgi:uncharacterized membrane protein YcjF (UPF0283 family)